MLEVNIEFADYKDLSRYSQVRLALRGEEFGFALEDNTLKINKKFKQKTRLKELVCKYFSFDHRLDIEDMEIIDDLFQRISDATNKNAAAQLSDAWSHALDKKLEADADKAAAAWLESTKVDDVIDSFGEEGMNYPSDVIRAIHRRSGKIDPIFVYGYLYGSGVLNMSQLPQQ